MDTLEAKTFISCSLETQVIGTSNLINGGILMVTLFWGLTFIVIVGLGIYAGRYIESSSDWALAGRSLGIGNVAAVLGAWQIGGVSIMGCTQDGYELGLSGGWYTITGAAYFFVLMLTVSMIRKKMTMDSVPGFFRERFCKTSGDLYSYIYI